MLPATLALLLELLLQCLRSKLLLLLLLLLLLKKLLLLLLKEMLLLLQLKLLLLHDDALLQLALRLHARRLRLALRLLLRRLLRRLLHLLHVHWLLLLSLRGLLLHVNPGGGEGLLVVLSMMLELVVMLGSDVLGEGVALRRYRRAVP